MTVLSYIIPGESVDDTVSNRVPRQILSLSGLNPDFDFPGFLSSLGIQLAGVSLGQVNTINFTGQATPSVVGNVATVNVSNDIQLGGVDQGPATTFNFVGSAITSVSVVNGVATITINGALPPPPSYNAYLFVDSTNNLHWREMTEINDGNSGTALTVGFNAGLNHKTTLTGACTFTFTAPYAGEVVVLKMVQDATGGRVVTWPGTVDWGSIGEPGWVTTANLTNIAVFYYDGTTYWGKSIVTGG